MFWGRPAAFPLHRTTRCALSLRHRRQYLSSASHLFADMEKHHQDVTEIAARVRQFYDRGEAFRVSHGSTNSTRPVVSKGRNLVDTSNLRHVLKVDTSARTCLVPPVVMEFPGITVGGGHAGTSGESSSFKHGFFDRTINKVEMVLADGSVVTCSDSERADLFHGAAGAVGTLGITTLVELQLIQATRYVETSGRFEQ